MMFRRIRRWLITRKAENELRGLDDKALRDLGINRGMIKYIVRAEAARLYP